MSYYDELGKRNQALRDTLFPSNIGGLAIKRVKRLDSRPRPSNVDLCKPAIVTGKRAEYRFNPDRHSTYKRGTSGAVYGD